MYCFILQTKQLLIMRIITPPSKLGLFQLLAACLLVALFTSPGDAHMGPMLMIKGGHGGGGGGGAAAILAAGLVIHLLTHLKKSHGGGGYSGGGGHGSGHGSGHEYSTGGGHGMMPMMGGGYGYEMEGYGMHHSFESHDEHLMDYGYEPQGYAWSKWILYNLVIKQYFNLYISA